MSIYPAEDFNRPQLKDAIVRKEQQELNISPVHKLYIPFKTATFGMGCFWDAESLYGGTKGVIRTAVGFARGRIYNPTYSNLGDPIEIVEIDYDPKVVSFKELLHLFWNNHELGLTTSPIKKYMSVILYHSSEQKTIARASKAEEQKRRAPEVITTAIEPATILNAAHDYHQKYSLQGHREFCATLGLNPQLLQSSYVATKLNGYLVGVGGIEQFKSEVDTMGLTPSQIDYCSYYVKKNQAQGLYG